MENAWGWVLSVSSLTLSKPSLPVLFLLAMASAALSVLSGCAGPPDRQNPLSVRSSARQGLLPDARSIQAHYRPAKPDGTPNSLALYHVPPVLSYEDRPLSDNMIGAIELADYASAVRRAGYWPYLEGEDNYTVLAIPNQPFETYLHEQENHLLGPERHDHLVGLVGQTILKGRWSLARIRRRAAHRGGSIQVSTLAGPGHEVLLRPVAGRGVQVIGRDGTAMIQDDGSRQANGMLFVIDSVLPRR